MAKDYKFIGNCASLDGHSINEMTEQAQDSTLATLRRHCDGIGDVIRSLGYDKDFPISKDWHVSYHKSEYEGIPCYYFVWSAFEYVWVKEGARPDRVVRHGLVLDTKAGRWWKP